VLELLPGTTLGNNAYQVSHKRPVGKAVRILIKLAEDVERLNRAGLGHNDIHPGNVKIDGERSASARLVDGGHLAPYAPGSVNRDIQSGGFRGLARVGLSMLTGLRSDAPGSVASIPLVSAIGADGNVVTLQAVILKALRNEYSSAGEFARDLRPFERL
jgi:hypothetical protein